MCKQYEIVTSYKITKKKKKKKKKKKIDTVGLCRPDVATDQDLHCFPLTVSHNTLNGVKPNKML